MSLASATNTSFHQQQAAPAAILSPDPFSLSLLAGGNQHPSPFGLVLQNHHNLHQQQQQLAISPSSAFLPAIHHQFPPPGLPTSQFGGSSASSASSSSVSSSSDQQTVDQQMNELITKPIAIPIHQPTALERVFWELLVAKRNNAAAIDLSLFGLSGNSFFCSNTVPLQQQLLANIQQQHGMTLLPSSQLQQPQQQDPASNNNNLATAAAIVADWTATMRNSSARGHAEDRCLIRQEPPDATSRSVLAAMKPASVGVTDPHLESISRNKLGRSYNPGRPLGMLDRQKILELYQKGLKISHIAKVIGVTHSCVSKIMTRYRRTGSIHPRSAQLLNNGRRQHHHHQQCFIGDNLNVNGDSEADKWVQHFVAGGAMFRSAFHPVPPATMSSSSNSNSNDDDDGNQQEEAPLIELKRETSSSSPSPNKTASAPLLIEEGAHLVKRLLE